MNEENRYAPPQAEVADVAADDVELASLGLRLGGSVIDALILAVVLGPILFAVGYVDVNNPQDPSFSDSLVGLLLGIVAFVAINGYLLNKSGQTIGKRLVGTRIVSFDSGALVPFQKVVGLRYLPMWLVSVVPVVGNIITLVNVLFIFRADRRCIHDLIAGTKVVKAN